VPAFIFAGDRRVWRAAAIVAVPLIVLMGYYLLRPRPYYTGTNSVEAYTYVAETSAHVPVCVPGLVLPAGTARVRLQLTSPTRERPALHLVLRLPGRAIPSQLGPAAVGASRISAATFAIPELPTRRPATSASLCITADDLVNWGGTPLPAQPPLAPPTAGGAPLRGRVAVWFEPAAGATQSYLSRAGTILRRASLFRPDPVGPWLYVILLVLVLPGLAVVSVRLLARAVEARTRLLGATLFVIAALNFVCWALITPSFQSPDEVDHFAYTQSLVERGSEPSRDPNSPLQRWSSSENLALEDMSFFTDHQVGDTRLPWLAQQQRYYRMQVATLHPRASDGGGNQTAATHGPIYYAALAPVYLAATSSPFSQLTLMRVASALIGALTVLFTFLLARELAPRRPWLAVLAALLVAYQPMYGFISGTVNNDVGLNAAAAALALLLIRMLRRGITVGSGALTGALLLALPNVKGTGLSLYPVAAVVFALVLWRHHDRADLPGWIALATTAILVGELSAHVLTGLHPTGARPGPAIGSNASAVSNALHHVPSFLAYLWQVFLPRLPFMTQHFPSGVYPAFVIFVERGWGAFGWYDVFFRPWVYTVILIAMLLSIPIGLWAAKREWSWVRGHWMELLALIAMPVAVVVGFEAAYYTPYIRPALAEFGRYAFPAIAPVAVLVVGALHAFGRRTMLAVGVGLLVCMIALSYASQLLTLTSFYA
jgi:4-amino-4-deoxy-L-arabinose transferase-like glycosyltransferase